MLRDLDEQMVPVMATKSGVCGSCFLGNRCISRDGMRGGSALLRAEIFKVYLGVKSGSKSAVEVGDGARYRILFGGFWGFVDN
jgi:hypothetical protein